MEKINYPKDYRYKCPITVFKRYVDIAAKLLEDDGLTILFGCADEVRLQIWIQEEDFNFIYPDVEFEKFKRVMNSEVMVLIEQILKFPSDEDPSLESFLQEKNVKKEQGDAIAAEKKEKKKYVRNQLMNDGMPSRFYFKTRTINDKLYNMDYEINRFVLNDDSDMSYAILEFSSIGDIIDKGIPNILIPKNNISKVKFVCDKHDIDYLIRRLEQIKERL